MKFTPDQIARLRNSLSPELIAKIEELRKKNQMGYGNAAAESVYRPQTPIENMNLQLQGKTPNKFGDFAPSMLLSSMPRPMPAAPNTQLPEIGEAALQPPPPPPPQSLPRRPMSSPEMRMTKRNELGQDQALPPTPVSPVQAQAPQMPPTTPDWTQQFPAKPILSVGEAINSIGTSAAANALFQASPEAAAERLQNIRLELRKKLGRMPTPAEEEEAMNWQRIVQNLHF